jgi:uncharacterized protein YfaS (alpha-2-macroglobulin family)
MFRLLAFASFILLGLGLPSTAAQTNEPAAQLLLPSRRLQATSTFEVRFAAEMVRPDQIGKATESPLVFDPTLKGQFVWLSTRSGSFAPASPFPLGTKVRISLRRGLKDTSGNEIAAQLNELAETPPMRMKGASGLGHSESDNATAVPRYLLLFNTNVEASAASKFIWWEDASGKRIPARVEQADPTKNKEHRFYVWWSDDHSLATWSESFNAKTLPEEPEGEGEEGAIPSKPAKKIEPRRNILFVTAEKPLPPGKDWQLVLEAGLPSAEWKIGLPERKTVNLGSVQPFVVKEAAAETNRNEGRRIVLRFSKVLATKVTADNAKQWISVAPAIGNLRAEIDGDVVILKANFSLETPYQATVGAGLPASEPFTLDQPFSKTLTFEKVAPRLYFEDFATHQLLSGTRRFRLLSINVPRLRLTAKLFSGAEIPSAVAEYDHYQEYHQNLPSNEYYSRIDMEKLAGRIIWQRDLTPRGEIDSQQSMSVNWDEILGSHRSGAVLLTAESIDPVSIDGKRAGTQALVQVTDLGAVWKRDRAGSLWHAFSLTSGKSLAGAKLRLLDKSQKQLAQATTDANGQARLPVLEEMRWVFASSADDSHLISIYSSEAGVPLYRLGLPDGSLSYGDGDEETDAVFLFTERGVYKPGDTLFLKGFAREPNDKGSRAAVGQRITVTATDARDREFFRKEIKLSEFGSFTEQIVLPDGTLGKFRIKAEGTGEEKTLNGNCTFQVQEYRPNAFEISIVPLPPGSGAADLEFPIAAKYLMGKPLTRAKLTWSLVGRDQAFTPEDLQEYAFCDAIDNFRLQRALDRVSQLNAQGSMDLDADGKAIVRTQFPLNPKAPQPRAAKLLCEITDLNQQTVSQSLDFVRQSSDYYFGLRRFEAVLKEGETLPIQLIAVKPDGKPWGESAKATLRLTRIEWQTNRLEGAGDTAEFESKPQLQIQWEKEITTASGQGADRKPISVSLEHVAAGKPGEYLLEANGRDASGHAIQTSITFEVAGPGMMTWDYRNSYAIDVSSDKESYEPGQTATLLVKTPIAGEALVTVEHERVVRSFIAKLSGNAPSIQVPITESDAPNVFVSVMVLRGSDASPRKIKAPEYRIGYCQLKVARPREKLRVQVSSATPAVKPGDTITLETEVRDFAGKAVVGAEVTLYAVDEGVLSLTGYKTPDALTFFNQLRRLGVQTSLTLPTLLREDLAESDFANKGYLIGDGKGGPATVEGLRTKFVACAYWNGGLRTDAAGRVRAEFAAPDSLTRYRVIAVATTTASQFGAGESAFEVNKPVMIEPALPRFGNVGDKIILRAMVHNTTELSGEADVEMQLNEVARAGQHQQRIALPAKGSMAIDFPIEFVAMGHAKWQWRVNFRSADGKTEFRDSVQSDLDVGYPAPLIREVKTKRVEQNETELARIGDPQILEGSGEAKISLTNTRTLELHEALRQLLEYPYGCVEQTTSSLLPWLTVRDLRAVFPELARPDAEVTKAVNRGLDLLMSMQTSGGGLSYWPRGNVPMLWGSAYGGLAFVLAEKAGFKVPEDNLNKLLTYLSQQLRGAAEESTGYGLSDRCLTVYTLALAGKAEPAYHEVLFKKRATLSAEDRALLALAIIESQGPVAMIDELLQPRIDEAAYMEQWFGSIFREYALSLLAWTRYQPRSPRVDELASDLFRRRSNGHWGTTQSNAWSLLALSSYLRAVETGDPNSRGEVRWATATKTFSLSKTKPLTTASFRIVPGAATAPIMLTKSGGQVFSEAIIEARPRLTKQPKQDRGYFIARRYARVEDDGRLTPAANLRVGDRILITLDLEVRRRATYVAIEDPLPGVFEPLNPAFKSQETLADESLGTPWISSYQEMRQDRVVFFSDLLYPGRYLLRYLARVVAAGDALAPAAKVQEMYHPERFGSTETQQVSTGILK